MQPRLGRRALLRTVFLGRIMRLPGRIVLLLLLLVQKRPDLIGGPLADRLRGTYAIRSRQRRIIPDSLDLVALALQYLPQLGLLLRVEPEPFREDLDATLDARPDRVAWRAPPASLNLRPFPTPTGVPRDPPTRGKGPGQSP